jgi:hypothetical protein
MATALRLRRGTTSQHSTFTGLEGEVTVDTTKDTVVVHNGSTAGGFPLAKFSEVVSKTSSTGSAVMPVGTTGERDGSPLTGYFRFNSSLSKFEGYNGTAWGSVGGGATGAGGDEIFVENGQTVTTSYTITSNRNAMSAGPITINSGITVTVPSGSRWVIV